MSSVVMKTCILFTALVILIMACLITGQYLVEHYSSHRKIIMYSAIATAIGAAGLNLLQFEFMRRLNFLRARGKAVSVVAFLIGVLAGFPVNVAKPLTHGIAIAALLLGIWGWLIDLVMQADLGLTSTLCTVTAGIGLMPMIPEFTSPTKDDNVAWVLPVGVILGLVLTCSKDSVKRYLPEKWTQPAVYEGFSKRTMEKIRQLEFAMKALNVKISALKEENNSCDKEIEDLKTENVNLETQEYDINNKIKEVISTRGKLTELVTMELKFSEDLTKHWNVVDLSIAMLKDEIPNLKKQVVGLSESLSKGGGTKGGGKKKSFMKMRG